MKDFMWNLFQKTGNIKSYILYRELVEKENSSSEERISFEQSATTNIN
ncbi:MAG TPA: YqzL family protein [Clostridiaceae bacterium]|nr:YqzL family protein [Clostridiaceae bacterium]